jgi:sRNA-binding carbon storage regulator CsrA
MALVISRKDGESIVVHHKGEELNFTVDRIKGTTVVKIDAPQSFIVSRREAIKEGAIVKRPVVEPEPVVKEGRDTVDCYVRTKDTGHWESGEVLSFQDTPSGRSYHVRLATGQVIKKCPSSDVEIVEEESEESFGSERPVCGETTPMIVGKKAS